MCQKAIIRFLKMFLYGKIRGLLHEIDHQVNPNFSWNRTYRSIFLTTYKPLQFVVPGCPEEYVGVECATEGESKDVFRFSRLEALDIEKHQPTISELRRKYERYVYNRRGCFDDLAQIGIRSISIQRNIAVPWNIFKSVDLNEINQLNSPNTYREVTEPSDDIGEMETKSYNARLKCNLQADFMISSFELQKAFCGFYSPPKKEMRSDSWGQYDFWSSLNPGVQLDEFAFHHNETTAKVFDCFFHDMRSSIDKFFADLALDKPDEWIRRGDFRKYADHAMKYGELNRMYGDIMHTAYLALWQRYTRLCLDFYKLISIVIDG